MAMGCGAAQSTATLTYGESARRDYERALRAFNDHDCLTAEPLFNNIVREYSYSRYAALAELRAADCEVQQAHYTEAIRRYRAFIRARPTHAEIDYANFQIASAYYRQIPQDFFLSPPREERDQAPTRGSASEPHRRRAEPHSRRRSSDRPPGTARAQASGPARRRSPAAATLVNGHNRSPSPARTARTPTRRCPP